MESKARPASQGAAKKSKKPSPARKYIFTVIKLAIIIFIAAMFAIAGIVGGAIYGYIQTAQPIRDEQLTGIEANRTTFIYDSKGNVIQKLTGKDNKDSIPITDSEAPKFLKDAIISIEDERFYSHNGVDIQGVLNIGVSFITNKGNPRGGSTITMQVVRNITGNTKDSLQRKVQEGYAAIQLEKKLTKREVLEYYMNICYWGNSCYGVESASKKYFGKDVWDLSLAQCALLAGIQRSPAYYDPLTESGRRHAKARQETILAKMLQLGKITQSQHDQALKEDLKYAQPDRTANVASVQSYFVDQVISDVKQELMSSYDMSSSMASYMIYNNGLHIYTTMDPDIQAAMDNVFMDDAYFPNKNKSAIALLEHPQAAMVILDSQNGQVKALRGGYGKKEASNTLNRATSPQMQRQPGSSFKPIAVYAPAIDLKLITPATIVDDVAVYMRAGDTSVSKSVWEREYPKNVDGKHDGLTTIRNAIKASVNVIAAKVWRDYLGPDNSVAYLKKVGIDREKEKYLSMAIGGLETGVNPLQMAAAYVPFAHKGMYFEPTTFTTVKDSDDKTLIEKTPKYDVAYSEQTAFLMADMMQEVTSGQNSTYPHGGTAASYVTAKTIGMPVAGKTGTTSDNRDKWFVGYTPYYVAATWYGYDNTIKPITINSDESSQALKIWAAVMKKVHEGLPQKEFTVPSGLVKKTICIYSGKIATDLCTKDPRGNATRTEYFIKGTEPRDDDLCTLHVQAKVCTESKDASGRNLLAGLYCPLDKVIDKVFIQRNPPYVPVKPGEEPPKDLIYELPAGEYCTLHGPPALPDGLLPVPGATTVETAPPIGSIGTTATDPLE